MSDERRKRGGYWPLAAIGMLLLLGAYIGGYFQLSQKNDLSRGGLGIYRTFSARSLCRFYWPLGWCECVLTGREVTHLYRHGDSGSNIGSRFVP